MASEQSFRKCVPPCPRYISGGDTHLMRVVCLGAQHAQAALEEAGCEQCELSSPRHQGDGQISWPFYGGYVIQFRCRPPSFNGVLPTEVGPEQALVMSQEVQTLLRKEAIERVPLPSRESKL